MNLILVIAEILMAQLLLLRPDEVSSRITYPAVLKVGHHTLRAFVQHRHVLVGSLA
jgi:hypothetical protein